MTEGLRSLAMTAAVERARSSVGESPSLLSWLSQVRFLPGAPTLTRLSCQRRSPTAKKAGARKSGESETIRGRGQEVGLKHRINQYIVVRIACFPYHAWRGFCARTR